MVSLTVLDHLRFVVFTHKTKHKISVQARGSVRACFVRFTKAQINARMNTQCGCAVFDEKAPTAAVVGWQNAIHLSVLSNDLISTCCALRCAKKRTQMQFRKTSVYNIHLFWWRKYRIYCWYVCNFSDKPRNLYENASRICKGCMAYVCADRFHL